MAGFFDPTTDKTTTTTTLPDWVDKAAQQNYGFATQLAQRPYQVYSYPRIAPFAADQTKAMDMLRSYTPKAATGIPDLKLPRLIDAVPGASGGPAGTTQDYMDPYIQNVVNRALATMRESADMGRKAVGVGAHNANAFGDARQGVEDVGIEERFQKNAGDLAASGYSDAYNNAMSAKGADIDRIMQSAQFNSDERTKQMNDLLTYVDSLYRSGGNQQSQTQRSLDLAKSDFDAQQNDPIAKLNLLISGLTNSPYGKTTTEATPGPSPASSILSTIGSVLGSIFKL